MANKQLMKLFIECPDAFRNTIITDNQLAIVEWIRGRGYPNTSAKELSEMKGVTVPNASTQLVKLWQRGYLKRTQYVDATGGIYYRYSAAI